MPHNILIVLWSHSNDWTRSIASRLLAMEAKLATAELWVTQYAAQLNSGMPFQGVFLAPEYFFTEPGNQRAPLPEDQRLEIEEKLLGLSRKFPRILLVPGTVFYRKELVRGIDSSVLKFDSVTGQRTLLKTTNPDRRARFVQKTQHFINTVPAQRDPTDRDLSAWAGSGYNASGHMVPSLNEIAGHLGDPNKQPGVAKNSAYILLGGRRIAKYDKQSDWGEALGGAPDQLAFIPGTFQQCPQLNGYRFGMEICYDHFIGMLARRNVTPLHLHFLVSDWVYANTGNMAMSPGGYFAHASTNYLQSALWRRTPLGALEDISMDDTYWMQKSTPQTLLDGYLVPLPAPLMPPRPNG